MYENPYDRQFGIEFEFNCPRLRSGNAVHYLLDDLKLSDWRVGHDGSGYEVKTSKLSGPTGFKKVKRFLDAVLEKEAKVSLSADGLHVHHDAPEFYRIDKRSERDPYYYSNRKALEGPTMRLLENWIAVQNEVYKMVNTCRIDRYACPAWLPSDLDYIRQNFDHYIGSYGRKNLNTSAIRKHGTIELRLHEGTLDYEEIFSWVRFGQAFIGKVVEETNAYLTASSAYELMREVKVSRNAMRFLSRKIEQNETSNPSYYSPARSL